MDPEQRTEREITYKVGWKRGKIMQNHDRNAADEAKAIRAAEPIVTSIVQRWNLRYVWRPAGVPTDSMMNILLVAFPVLTFAISLWLVYNLAVQP